MHRRIHSRSPSGPGGFCVTSSRLPRHLAVTIRRKEGSGSDGPGTAPAHDKRPAQGKHPGNHRRDSGIPRGNEGGLWTAQSCSDQVQSRGQEYDGRQRICTGFWETGPHDSRDQREVPGLCQDQQGTCHKEPFGGVGYLVPEVGPQVTGDHLSLERAQQGPEPVCRLHPHLISHLVQQDCTGRAANQPPGRGPGEDETKEQDDDHHDEGVGDGSPPAKDRWDQQPEGFVKEVRQDRSGNTEGDSPPVTRQVPDCETEESTGEYVGCDEHAGTP